MCQNGCLVILRKPGGCCSHDELALHQGGGAGNACVATLKVAFVGHANVHVQAGVCLCKCPGGQGQLP